MVCGSPQPMSRHKEQHVEHAKTDFVSGIFLVNNLTHLARVWRMGFQRQRTARVICHPSQYLCWKENNCIYRREVFEADFQQIIT